MELRKGYKQTEVGIIPEDWEVKPLREICSMKSGLGITSASILLDGKYPCFGGNGIRGYVNSYTHKGAYPLIGRQGALCGNINYIEGAFFASEHAVVVTPKHDIDAKWLSNVLVRMNLNQYSESSAQPGLSINKIDLLRILILIIILSFLILITIH
jgi:type I restriction enzyme S subunit